MTALNTTCEAQWDGNYGPPAWPPSSTYAPALTGIIQFNPNGTAIWSTYQTAVEQYFAGLSPQVCINPTYCSTTLAKETELSGNWAPSTNYHNAALQFIINTTGVTGALPDTNYTALCELSWEDPEPANGQPNLRYWELIFWQQVSAAAAPPLPRRCSRPRQTH